MSEPQSKDLKPQRDASGRILPGSTANAGGMTAEQKAARATLNLWLCAEPQLELGKAAYRQALADGNPAIIKDFMDRIAGPVKALVEHSGDASEAMKRIADMFTRDEMLAIARDEKP